MNELLIDTVALVRYLEDRLPSAADGAFRDGEAGRTRLLLPQIALGEFIYVALRGRIRSAHSRAAVEEVTQHILASDFIAVTAMPSKGWDVFLQLEIPELHDRMIAAEAIARGIPLVSGDPIFTALPGLTLIWK